MRPRISVCNLGVQDLERARSFYEGMGFKARQESSERAVFFQLEWSWLSLFPRERLAGLCGKDPTGSGFPGFCFSHSVTSADEVNQILDRAVELGGAVASPHAAVSTVASATSPTLMGTGGRWPTHPSGTSYLSSGAATPPRR